MPYCVARKQSCRTLVCAVALFGMAGAAQAQAPLADPGYLTDRQGAPVRSDFGLCWRFAGGPVPASSPECDPDFATRPSAARAAPAPRRDPPASLTPAPARRDPPPRMFSLPTPALQKIVLDADARFGFDQTALDAAGRAVLDDFLRRLATISAGAIRLVGHADRLGSEAYNQDLSEQRVEAVRRYLVSRGIDPEQLRVEARGQSEPVTRVGACGGGRSAQVIACLQPDRRVAVEAAGTRAIKQ